MSVPTNQVLLDSAKSALRRVLTSGQSVTLGETTFNRANVQDLRELIAELGRAVADEAAGLSAGESFGKQATFC